MNRCRWVYDKDVPDGKFLVPGCWNRTIYGDYAECQCREGPETIGDQLAALRSDIAALKKKIAALAEIKGEGHETLPNLR